MKRLSLMLLLVGCGGAANVRPRAAADLRCPEESLQVREIDSHTSAVEGCGRQATYIYSVSDHVWKIDGAMTDVAPSATPQPPAAAPAPSAPVSANPPPSGGPQ